MLLSCVLMRFGHRLLPSISIDVLQFVRQFQEFIEINELCSADGPERTITVQRRALLRHHGEGRGKSPCPGRNERWRFTRDCGIKV